MAESENGIIYVMRLLLLVAAMATAGIVAADQPSPAPVPIIPDFPLYLGLAVPLPDTIPAMSVLPSPARYVPNGEYRLMLEVDKKGRVKKLRFPADSAWCYGPVTAVQGRIRFRLLGGDKIDFPVKVPARLSYVNEGTGGRVVRLQLPISADSISDGPLLVRFFEENAITLPAVTALPPISFQLPRDLKPTDCRTITALLTLDKKGNLEDLSFPFPEGEGMTHPIRSALINGTFQPAAKKGKPFPCRFLVTFRIFDNLRYPFSPFAPPDTAGVEPVTAEYFMTSYYNPLDIALYPLPRSSAAGVIRAGAFARGYIGTLRGEVMIDPEGNMARAMIRGAGQKLEDMARKVLRLTDWYPARNNRGEAIWFTGPVSIRFDGTSNVVYIAEWLK